jgi:hypothetical protein
VPARTPPELVLLHEAKITDLLPREADGMRRYELSGITLANDRLYVIFDDTRDVGVLHRDLTPGAGNHLFPVPRGPGTGYEDIAHDPLSGHFYLLIESLPHDDGFTAAVDEYDQNLVPLSHSRLDFPVPSANKGLEGLTLVRRGGDLFLLGMCEGNRCAAGKEGRRPGGGRVMVFRRRSTHKGWRHVTTMRLPESLPFEDYSSLAVSGERIVVVSQQSSALWVGRLAPDGSWRVDGEGATYLFPRDRRGQARYCTIEGVSWLDADRFVVVSDKVKKDDADWDDADGGCRAKQQSVHMFAMP